MLHSRAVIDRICQLNRAISKLTFACATLVLIALAAADAAAGTLDRIRDRHTIVFAYRDGAAPFSFKDRDGKVRGYTAELCTRVAAAVQRQLGLASLDVQWIPVDADNRVEAVTSGRADAECGTTTITLSRMERVDFSLPIFVDGGALAVKTQSQVKRLVDLGGRRVAVIPGTTTERALRAGLSNAGTIHLATFGVLNKRNPLFSYVELARGPLEDGRLEVNEVFGLGLAGQLVILSACQTALAAGANEEVPAGDDWIGLVQAFLQGGASRVMASLWPVEDRNTALLMERFHRRLAAGRSPVVALAESQREMLRHAETAAPFFWAAFVITD